MSDYSKPVIDAVGIELKDANDDAVDALVVRPSGALVAAVQRAGEYRRANRSEATQRAYQSDWKRFSAWATANGATPLPVTQEVLCAYLVSLAEGAGYSVASIERFLAAAVHYHRRAGHELQRNAPPVAATLDAIRRRIGAKKTKKAPLGVQALAEICERLKRTGGPNALRDRALLTTGWFCMLRSSNLVAIRREHVRLVRFRGDEWIDTVEQPEGLIVHLPQSKTDQRKEGRDVAVHSQADPTICPVATLAEYLGENGFAPDERIFPISERTVSRTIKLLVADPAHRHSVRDVARCASCAAVAARFASHSLRRGAATAQALRGVEEREIMRQGGWKSERVMRGYLEAATIFQNNPTKGLGLPVKGIEPPGPPQSPVPEAPKRRRRRLRRWSYRR